MIRFAAVLISLTMLTLLLAPFQLIALAFGLRWQQSIPHLFHRVLCALIGVRIHEVGKRTTDTPVRNRH